MSKFGWKYLLVLLLVVVSGTVFLSGCVLNRRRHADLAAAVNAGDQPDKILFDKAINEIKHGRYDIGRLTLQTLINTYPDSEFLAKAKLAIANSYFDQGGTAGFTQAESEYKDFITFFPTAPEAPEAQYRIGMSHFYMMAKADRDPNEARLAEAELKEFLVRYPSSPMTIRVKARLRETQEVLAQGEYETASFYLMRGSYRAARGRFREVVEKYPNFSSGDEALYGLAQSLEHLRTPKEAVPYYSRLVSDFPFSSLVPNAKARLLAMKEPVPVPTKATMARAQADLVRIREKSMFEKLVLTMSSKPDASATLRGPVHLQANPTEAASAPLPPVPPANASIIAEPLAGAAAETASGEETTGGEGKKEAVKKTEEKDQGFGNKSTIFKVQEKDRLSILKKVIRKDQGSEAKAKTKKSGEQGEASGKEEKKGRLSGLKKSIIRKDENYGGEEKKAGSAGKETGAKAKQAGTKSGGQSAASAPEKKKNGPFHAVTKVVRKDKGKNKEKDTKKQETKPDSTGKETGTKAKEAGAKSGEQPTASAPEKKGRFHIVKKIVRKDKKAKTDESGAGSTGKETDAKAKDTGKDSGSKDQ